jgi:hypothetical protein
MAVAVALLLMWFRNGTMLGWAEGGIPFFNPAKDYFMTSTAWYEYQLGNAAPTTVGSSPFYFVLSIFETLGVPSVAMQVGTFFALLTTSGVAMARLAQELYGNKSRLVGLGSGLFYMLNPISMVLWHKFLLTYIFAYASFPLLFYLFVRLIYTRRYSYGFWFGVASVVFSYGLLSPGFIIPFAASLTLFSAYHIISRRTFRNAIHTTIATLTTFFLWAAMNSWWDLQLLFTAQYQFAQGFASTASVDLYTLNAVSISYHSTPDNLIRLIYWTYTLGGEVTTGWFYSNTLVIAFGFVPLAVGTCALLFGRRKAAAFPAVLLVGIMYFAKGSGPPAPELFLWLFNSFQLFRIFRNPVETFGALIPLAFSPLLGIGLVTIATRFKSYLSRFCSSPTTCKLPGAFGRMVPIVILLTLTSVYVFPMWTGTVFTTATYTPTNNPSVGYSVVVPSDYSKVNSVMSKTPGLYRVMVLPLDNGGVTYNWGYGYNGGDIADELYRVPAVSQSLTYSLFGTPYLTSSLNSAAVSDPANFWKLVAITNSRYIVVSNDVNATDRQLVSPDIIRNGFTGAYSPSVSGGRINLTNSHVSSIPSTEGGVSMAWADSTPKYLLSVSPMAGAQDNPVINATANPGNGGLGVWIQIPSNMTNTLSERYLEVWLRSSQGGSIYIEARDPLVHSATWDGRLNPNYSLIKDEWKLVVLPLDVPSEFINTPGTFDRGNVMSLLVGMTNLDHTLTNLEIGGIFLDQGSFSGSARNISLVGQYGQLTLYQLTSSVFLPRIYPITGATIENSTGTFLSNLAGFNPIDTAVVQSSEIQHNGISLPTSSLSEPDLSFHMVSPSLYDVHVNASGPYILVLSETYNPLWTASGPWGTIPETNHFVANGYANMWYITQPGVYHLQLRFLPNSYLTYGTDIALLTSILTFAGVYRKTLKRVPRRIWSEAVSSIRRRNVPQSG